MENKNDVTTEDVKNGTGEDTADTTTEDTSDSKEKTGTKAKLSPDEEYAQLEGRLKRLGKKIGKTETTATKTDEAQTKSKDLDYGQKAYLVASGVKGSEETQLVKDFMANTGKSLDEVVESKFFQAELKELRDAKATSDAIPKGTKRSGQSSKDSVDYWLAKGELPPNTPENTKLRRDVVNAKYVQETSGSKFGSPTGSITRQSQMK